MVEILRWMRAINSYRSRCRIGTLSFGPKDERWLGYKTMLKVHPELRSGVIRGNSLIHQIFILLKPG